MIKNWILASITSIITLVTSLNISPLKAQEVTKQHTVFTEELQSLQNFFSIPGMAILVQKDGKPMYRENFGFADIEKKIEVSDSTLFPIASITKTFSAILILKMVEAGKIHLEDQANTYIPQYSLNDSIQIKHLLSHTSQGQIGKQFYYSNRFGLLTEIIEKVSRKPFKEVMEEVILNPLSLENTFLMTSKEQLGDRIDNHAKPYFFEGESKLGFIDEGHSASAGIVSTITDLSKFDLALDQDLLLQKESKKLMLSPFEDGLPYGFGIFSQMFKNYRVLWAYGQYDCYASLFIKVPSKNITLIVLANNNLMSDAPRLINGDIKTSLFALSFFKNFIFNEMETPLFPTLEQLKTSQKNELSQVILMANAQSRAFMARFDLSHLEVSKGLLKYAFETYPDVIFQYHLNLLHTMSFIKNVHFYRELGEFNDFDENIKELGNKILNDSPNNPYANIYMGTFYDRNGEKEKAKFHFSKIVNAKNFSENWYTKEAVQWIKSNISEKE